MNHCDTNNPSPTPLHLYCEPNNSISITLAYFGIETPTFTAIQLAFDYECETYYTHDHCTLALHDYIIPLPTSINPSTTLNNTLRNKIIS